VPRRPAIEPTLAGGPEAGEAALAKAAETAQQIAATF